MTTAKELKDKSFRTDCGYPCDYTPTVMDGPVFRWGDERFEISASRNGVMIVGHSPCLKESGFTRFQAILLVAYSVHCQLRVNDRREDMWFGDCRVDASAWEKQSA